MEYNKKFDPVARMRHEIEHSKETVMLSRDGKMVGKIVNPPTTKVAGFPSFKERNLLTKWYSNPSASKSRRTNSPQES